ncbi:MAG TPA: hypothetical protein VKP66_02160 [Steroidobacteraceae bacterium]|nr:hypothetical protein [Steroidobacteraceae bacterium]
MGTTAMSMGADTAMTDATTKSAGGRLECRVRRPAGRGARAPGVDMARRFFGGAASILAIASALLLTPLMVANADSDPPQDSPVSTHAKAFGAAVKRDAKVIGEKSKAGAKKVGEKSKEGAKVVGEKTKEGAHRVAVAAKAVGHEVATAAKRGAAETRAAFRGEKPETPAN